jgi:integrase
MRRNRRAGVEDRWHKGDGAPSVRYGKGRRWLARYVDDRGVEHTKSFTRKVDAGQWLDGQTAAVVSGTHVDPRAGDITLREYAEHWRKIQVQRPSSRAHIETMLRRHAYPTLGNRPLSSILPSDIQAWVKGLELAPATVGVIHGIVSTIMKAAIRDRRIASNPCEGSKLPKVERKRIVPLTTDQVNAVRDALPAELRALVTLAAGTGMRQGECFGLTVDRVKFLERTVTVDHQLVTVPGQPPTLSPPKTQASNRTIPLPQVVVDALAAHLAAFPAEPDGLVFTLAGKPITRSVFGHKWRSAVDTAGLPAGTGFHGLRHYYASLLIRHGESVKRFRRGWGTPARSRRWTPTATCGPIPTTALGTRSTRYWDLLRTSCGLRKG